MRLRVLIAVTALACGAADEDIDITHAICSPLRLVAAPGARVDEQRALGEAIELWRRAGGSGLTLDPLDGAPVVEVRFEDAAPLFHGLYDDERGVVYVNHQLPDAAARAVTIAHELGHVFGLAHVAAAERPSVMNAGNLTIAPTAADWSAARALAPGCAAD